MKKTKIYTNLKPKKGGMMKRLCVVIIVMSMCFTAKAGEIYAFGLGVGFGGRGLYRTNSWDVIVKEYMGEISDVELTISFYYKDWDEETEAGLAALLADIAYLWRWNISGGINWYAGPLMSVGLSLAVYSVTETRQYYPYDTFKTDEMFYGAFWGIGAQIGVEYDFNVDDVPLVIGLNMRPELNIAKPQVINPLTLSLHIGITYTYK